MAAQSTALVINLDQLGKDDIEMVGGKNASLGEMISHLSDLGVSVPGGFATTSNAFNRFLTETGLLEKINNELNTLDVNDVNKLAATGKKIRTWIIEQELPKDLEQEVRQAFETMSGGEDIAVAVRSSATAEDLPDASFAGQQETFLNIRGIDNVLIAIKEVFASLYNDRAISYRVHKGFEHEGVALSAAVQRMVRSETGAAGVMFTLDTESGFDQVVFITSSYGLGEMVVQGAVNPDEFYISKRLLADGKPAVIRRNLGSKHKKMVYGDEGSTAKSVKTVDVEKQDRMQFSLTTEELTSLA
ncbi:MAG: PEP/pyruvate-binding domain-containing protein, partial [Pseudomonadota bacterium]|nr:PEP/pyruvate-binding domain-containing protein [Pseudomonadota bacterium]